MPSLFCTIFVGSASYTQSGIVFQAQSGVQWLDLTGHSSNSPANGVRQIVPNQAGNRYELKFHVGSATGGNLFFLATVDLSINGGSRTSFSNPTGPSSMLNWKPFTVQFAATSASTSLTFFNGSAANNFISPLDNVSLNPVGPDGDFNNDGLYNCADINALTATIAAGTNLGSFDLTGDGFVNLADQGAWLSEAGGINIGPGRVYKLGDANLNGVVDGSDFGIWNSSKFTSNTAWCSGGEGANQ